MKVVSLICALVLASCSQRVPSGLGTSHSSSSSFGSLAAFPISLDATGSSSTSLNPKKTVYLQWQVKKLDTIIKGQPRRKLSLLLTGAKRQLAYIGTFNGETFDLAGTYVTQTGAILKASIWWAGTGQEIWVDRAPDGVLEVHQRDNDEERPYLSVNRVLQRIPVPGDLHVIAR